MTLIKINKLKQIKNIFKLKIKFTKLSIYLKFTKKNPKFPSFLKHVYPKSCFPYLIVRAANHKQQFHPKQSRPFHILIPRISIFSAEFEALTHFPLQLNPSLSHYLFLAYLR